MGNAAGVSVGHVNVNVHVHLNDPNRSAAPNANAPWLAVAGGAALGATLAGPAGALVGALVGGAGFVAHVTTAATAAHAAPQQEATTATSAAAPTWLPYPELQRIDKGGELSSDSRESRVVCCVCSNRHTKIALVPCGHACMCGTCAESLRAQAAPELPRCPLCRVQATGCHRIFL